MATKSKKSEGGSHTVTMRRFKVHGKTTQYRQSDGKGGHMETADAEVGPVYITKDIFGGEDGPKKLKLTIKWE